MSTSDMLSEEMEKLNISDNDIPQEIISVANSIPAQIPFRMKLAMAVSEVTLFASQFRLNIQHWNNSIIPVNSIMFIIAKSGTSKDSSFRYVRRCFEQGYKTINERRKKEAIDRAIEEATINGDESPESFQVYKRYLKVPPPLFSTISTPEGLIQHLNDLEHSRIGAGYIYAGEFGSELQSNPNISETLKVISELYDMGKKEVKLLKDRTLQTKEINEMPMNALFQSSQDMIIYDDSIRRKFKLEFTSKLARRSFFIFINEKYQEKDYKNIEELLREEKSYEDEAMIYSRDVSEYINNLAERLLSTAVNSLLVSREVRDMFILYKKYNEYYANTIHNRFPITRLTRQHMQWKALKLSGAIAIFTNSSVIQVKHYRAAIRFVEIIFNDVLEFEKELQKEPYELFVDYVHNFSINGKCSVMLHDMRKMGFLNSNKQLSVQLGEIARMCNSYDSLGLYTAKQTGIEYKENKSSKLLISFLDCSGTKEERKRRCSGTYQCEEIEFKNIYKVLQEDVAYSPFRFKNGLRGKDNIDSGCKWIVLDIDDTEITDEEAHILLEDLNHFIARTSNPDNPNKYRIILELDSEVDIPDIKWTKFISEIGKDLGFKVDNVPKSQIFFSYKDRKILGNTSGGQIKTKDYIDFSEKPVRLPGKEESARRLANKFDTFSNAFNAKNGEGRRKMIWAAKYARELGADKNYVLSLIIEINDYWVKPLSENMLNQILNQISRWEF